MTPARLAEIRAALEKATPGEWSHDGGRCVMSTYDSDLPRALAVCEGIPNERNDARFIALAHGAVPELLSELDRLRAEAAKQWQRLHEIEGECDVCREACAEPLIRVCPTNPYRSGP